jgi:hypothetical protein
VALAIRSAAWAPQQRLCATVGGRGGAKKPVEPAVVAVEGPRLPQLVAARARGSAPQNIAKQPTKPNRINQNQISVARRERANANRLTNSH